MRSFGPPGLAGGQHHHTTLRQRQPEHFRRCQTPIVATAGAKLEIGQEGLGGVELSVDGEVHDVIAADRGLHIGLAGKRRREDSALTGKEPGDGGDFVCRRRNARVGDREEASTRHGRRLRQLQKYGSAGSVGNLVPLPEIAAIARILEDLKWNVVQVFVRQDDQAIGPYLRQHRRDEIQEELARRGLVKCDRAIGQALPQRVDFDHQFRSWQEDVLHRDGGRRDVPQENPFVEHEVLKRFRLFVAQRLLKGL